MLLLKEERREVREGKGRERKRREGKGKRSEWEGKGEGRKGKGGSKEDFYLLTCSSVVFQFHCRLEKMGPYFFQSHCQTMMQTDFMQRPLLIWVVSDADD